MAGHRSTVLDYEGLLELAKSRRVKVIEAEGLGPSSGICFNKGGSEWIAIDSSLPIGEKTRTLGFLLENYPGMTGHTKWGPGEVALHPDETHFQALQCTADRVSPGGL
jgi:hypothetical protein